VLFEAFTRIGQRRAPLKPPPSGVFAATTAELPPPLRRFRHPEDKVVTRDTGPEIAFPLNGVTVDLGIREGDPAPLVIKVRNGAPPFTFFANGVPVGRSPFSRAESWQPDGSGFVTLSVVDSTGRSDRVTVFVE
jgi:penicillin-binding protein 1C